MNQGSKSVEEYYQELLVGLARCDIHENDQDLYARFMGGLNCDIQDILDYKEWTRFSQLYHLALKAERKVQGHQHSFKGNSSKPCPHRVLQKRRRLPHWHHRYSR